MNERLTGPEIQAIALIRFPEVYVSMKMYLWTDEQTVEWLYVTFPRSKARLKAALKRWRADLPLDYTRLGSILAAARQVPENVRALPSDESPDEADDAL